MPQYNVMNLRSALLEANNAFLGTYEKMPDMINATTSIDIPQCITSS